MNKMLNFNDDDLVLVTGASSGIGQATALTLNALGARVIAVGRSKERLARLLGSAYDNTLIHIEVFDFIESVDRTSLFIESLVGKYGKISGFVHSAGALRIAPIRSEDLSEQYKLFNLNFFSALSAMKILANKRYKADRLSCVLLSSISGFRGEGGLTTYSASKGALMSAVRALAKELGRLNIRVNSVAPGTIKTNISLANPAFFNDNYYEKMKNKWVLPYVSSPEQVANLVVFLLSDASSWITGQNIVIDGGESL